MKLGRFSLLVALVISGTVALRAQERQKIIIDQDEAGPGGTDQQATLLLIQSPKAEVLGITVVTGDAWLNEEVAHTLRMLELTGHTDIPGTFIPLGTRRYRG